MLILCQRINHFSPECRTIDYISNLQLCTIPLHLHLPYRLANQSSIVHVNATPYKIQFKLSCFAHIPKIVAIFAIENCLHFCLFLLKYSIVNKTTKKKQKSNEKFGVWIGAGHSSSTIVFLLLIKIVHNELVRCAIYAHGHQKSTRK